jgi:hypothetical protein
MSERRVSDKHMFWGDPAKFDLAKMRADATRAARGDATNKPRTVTIHMHAYGERCKDKEHETYEPPEA